MPEPLDYASPRRRPRPVLRTLAGFVVGLCLATSCGWILSFEPLWFIARVLTFPYFAAVEYLAPHTMERQDPMIALPPLLAWFLGWGTLGAVVGLKRAKADATE